MKIKHFFIISLMFLTTLSGCAKTPQRTQSSLRLIEKNIVTLSNGQGIDLWQQERGFNNFYTLTGGTTLLIESTNPTTVRTGTYTFNQVAQDRISKFYEDQGLLYNLEEYLEKAYNEYTLCKTNKTRFSEGVLSQEVFIASANDTIACFTTSVTLPLGNQLATGLSSSTVFNRETGEVINTWDLFSVPEDSAKKQLLSKADVSLLLEEEMNIALKAQYIILTPNSLDMSFPQGSLPSQEHSYYVTIEYGQLDNILHPWAIPTPTEN